MLLQSNFSIFEQLQTVLNEFMRAIPNLIGALVLLILGWIIAKFIASIVKKILRKTGVDKLAEKLDNIDLVQRSGIKIVPSTLLSKVFYYLLFFVFAIAATDVLKMPAVSDLVSQMITYIPQFISGAILLLVGLFFADFLKNIIVTACQSLGIGSAKVIGSVFFYFLFINIALSALKQASLNIDFLAQNISIVLAGAALAFGLGYGLAAKDVFANILHSFYQKNKWKIGQVVTYNGHQGQIVSLDKNEVRLETAKGELRVPMHRFVSSEIIIHKQNT